LLNSLFAKNLAIQDNQGEMNTESIIMQLSSPTIDRTCPEYEIYETLLSLDDKNILELGCGKAELTRQIATHGGNRRLTATEVDEFQHNQNLLIDDLPNVTFITAGSQAIPVADNTFDYVLMFKSLHHVPSEMMETAMSEVARVLKPGGIAYISEPIFSGSFNDVLRLFHDEEEVRQRAFNAIKTAVEKQQFTLLKQVFFNTPIIFQSFAEFERNVIKVSHSSHQLAPEILQQVKTQFMRSRAAEGYQFLVPIRVDLLQTPV